MPGNDVFQEKDKSDPKKINIYLCGNVAIAILIVVKIILRLTQLSSIAPDDRAGNIMALIVMSGLSAYFAFAGWHFTAGYTEKIRKNRDQCRQTVEAKIIDCKVVETHDEDSDSTSYYAVYSFSWNGTDYCVRSKDDYMSNPPLNTFTKLMIDPSNPENIYEIHIEEERIKKNRKLGFILLGVALVIYVILV